MFKEGFYGAERSVRLTVWRLIKCRNSKRSTIRHSKLRKAKRLPFNWKPAFYNFFVGNCYFLQTMYSIPALFFSCWFINWFVFLTSKIEKPVSFKTEIIWSFLTQYVTGWFLLNNFQLKLLFIFNKGRCCFKIRSFLNFLKILIIKLKGELKILESKSKKEKMTIPFFSAIL